MAAKKKYYWIKLKDDFFHNAKIKKLRRINNTDRYVTIYQKLLLLSIKEDRKTEKDTLGILTYEGLENTFTGEIAMKIDEEDEDVKTAIEYLLKYKMMEKLSENQYYMTEIVLVTGKEDENIAKNKSIRQSEKTPLTNGQRQKRYKAKKACKEKQYVNMISDKENRDFYNGCYYLAIKKDKYRCKICGAMKDLRAVVLDENNREITYPGDVIVTENNMITMCPTCYHNVILSNESNHTPVISTVSPESNENIEIEKEIDIEKEEDKKPTYNSNLGEVSKIYEKNMGKIYPAIREWIIDVSEKIESPLFERAIQICIDKCMVTPSYLKGIIKKWEEEGITTLEQLQQKEVEYRNRQQNKSTNEKSVFKGKISVEDEEIKPELLAELEKFEEKNVED